MVLSHDASCHIDWFAPDQIALLAPVELPAPVRRRAARRCASAASSRSSWTRCWSPTRGATSPAPPPRARSRRADGQGQPGRAGPPGLAAMSSGHGHRDDRANAELQLVGPAARSARAQHVGGPAAGPERDRERVTRRPACPDVPSGRRAELRRAAAGGGGASASTPPAAVRGEAHGGWLGGGSDVRPGDPAGPGDDPADQAIVARTPADQAIVAEDVERPAAGAHHQLRPVIAERRSACRALRRWPCGPGSPRARPAGHAEHPAAGARARARFIPGSTRRTRPVRALITVRLPARVLALRPCVATTRSGCRARPRSAPDSIPTRHRLPGPPGDRADGRDPAQLLAVIRYPARYPYRLSVRGHDQVVRLRRDLDRPSGPAGARADRGHGPALRCRDPDRPAARRDRDGPGPGPPDPARPGARRGQWPAGFG